MSVQQIAERYRIVETLGEGGMGIVYRAMDLRTSSYVAIKTMRDVSDPAAVEMFSREWNVLASISHPNIIDIRDVGEIEERGQRKPFFVMPLLAGRTLAAILESPNQRLAADRLVDIICQVCRGLHAAHDRGLVHRDIKPSNIFVMDDDSIKIIDFGIAHLADTRSATGLKGTWQYMSPEQVDFKPATPLSDLFSLGVVCYEALTGIRPFARKTQPETAEAIRRHIPAPISEVNPSVSQYVSMVVHKAMAKQPVHRFSSAREFAEALQKAQMNQPLERFDRARIQPRIERAKKAFTEADYAFSSEILTELEAEGHIDREITLLRVQVEQASRRIQVRQLIEGAKARIEQDEVPLALEKLQAVLEIDPDNPDALALKTTVEKQRNERQLEGLVSAARGHLERRDFSEARQALEDALKIRPADTAITDLLNETDRREQNSLRIRAEKEKLYAAAVNAYQNGEIGGALNRLERILEIVRRTPEAAIPQRDAIYQSFHNQVRSERDALQSAYDECRGLIGDRNFTAALETSERFLAKYPGDALLQAFRIEAMERQGREMSTYLSEIEARVDAETDPDRKAAILREACDRYPNEPRLQQAWKLAKDRRDLTLSIVTKARQYDERSEFAEAIAQWNILRDACPQYPGIGFEVAQVETRRERQAKEEAKARLVEQIDRALESGDFEQARAQAADALSHYPEDQELAALERLAAQGIEKSAGARQLRVEAERLNAEKKLNEAAELLRRALKLTPKDASIRDLLIAALTEQARLVMEESWREAEPLAQEAAALDATHSSVRQTRALLADARRRDFVAQCLAEARENQAVGNVRAALEAVEGALAAYPNEPRLAQLQATLRSSIEESRRLAERNQDAESLKKLAEQLQRAPEGAELAPVIEQSQAIIRKHPDDAEIASMAAEIRPRTNTPVGVVDNISYYSATQAPRRPPAVVPEAVSNGAPPAVPETPPPAPPDIPAVEKAKAGGFPTAIVAVLACLVVAAILGAAYFMRRPKPEPPRQPVATTVAVRLNAVPADASILVNGEARTGALQLDPNLTYEISVSRLGYRPLTQHAVRPAADWNFTLQPEPVHLRFLTAEKPVSILIDGREIGNTPDAEWTPDAKEHALSIRGVSGEALSFSFKAEPGARPVVSGIGTKDAVVVSVLGRDAWVYSGSPDLRANLADQPPRLVPAGGLNLSLPGQPAEVNFDRKDLPKIAIEPGNAPSLVAAVNSDANFGSVYIAVNVDGAKLFVDGVEIHQAKKGGWWIQRRPGKYALKITAADHEDFNDTLELEKGASSQRRVDLRSRPTTATLAIQGGTPGAEALVDGTPVGTLDSNGSLRRDIAPGQHKIGFRKEFFEASSTSRSFVAGQTATLGAADARMKEFGTLTLKVTPPEAQVSVRRADQNETRAAHPGDSVRAPEGRYIVSAQADGYVAKVVSNIVVNSGKVATVEVALARGAPKTESTVNSPAPATTPSLFTQPDRIEQAGEWLRGKGSGYVFLSPGVRRFTLTFSNPGKGVFGRSKKVEWVAHYAGDHDKVAYELDGGKLTRRATTSGVEDKAVHVEHSMGADTKFTVSITVEPGLIVVSAGGQVLDMYKADGQDLTTGSIGIKAGQLFTIVK